MAIPVLPSDPENYNLESVFQLGNSMVEMLLGFAIGIGAVALLWGAIQYFAGATGGSEDKSQKGKNIVLWAVIGIVVILLSKLILAQFVNIVKPNPVNVPPGADIVKDVI